MSKRKRIKRRLTRRPTSPKRRTGGVSFVIPEGDALVSMSACYRHTNLAEIRQILTKADDFGLDDDAEADPDSALHFPWFETDSDKPGLFVPIGQRVLAHLTVTANTLDVDAMSQERMERCSQRLEQLLGERIYLAEHKIEPVERTGQKSKPQRQPAKFVTPSPEVIVQFEEQMLRQWIDESIPALGGLTPRQAVKTPEGRQQVLELIEESEQMQGRMKNVPGMFAPDYGKVKQMLNLE